GVRAGCDGGPSGRLVAVVGEDADGRAGTDQSGDVLAPGRSAQFPVELRRDPVAQAPADVRFGRLRPDHGADVLEDGGGADFDGHTPTMPRRTGRCRAVRV